MSSHDQLQSSMLPNSYNTSHIFNSSAQSTGSQHVDMYSPTFAETMFNSSNSFENAFEQNLSVDPSLSALGNNATQAQLPGTHEHLDFTLFTDPLTDTTPIQDSVAASPLTQPLSYPNYSQQPMPAHSTKQPSSTTAQYQRTSRYNNDNLLSRQRTPMNSPTSPSNTAQYRLTPQFYKTSSPYFNQQKTGYMTDLLQDAQYCLHNQENTKSSDPASLKQHAAARIQYRPLAPPSDNANIIPRYPLEKESTSHYKNGNIKYEPMPMVSEQARQEYTPQGPPAVTHNILSQETWDMANISSQQYANGCQSSSMDPNLHSYQSPVNKLLAEDEFVDPSYFPDHVEDTKKRRRTEMTPESEGSVPQRLRTRRAPMKAHVKSSAFDQRSKNFLPESRYGPFSPHFRSSYEAQEHLSGQRWFPPKGLNYPTNNQEKLVFVKQIYDAMTDFSGFYDHPVGKSKNRMLSQQYGEDYIEARAWEVVDTAIDLYEHGSSLCIFADPTISSRKATAAARMNNELFHVKGKQRVDSSKEHQDHTLEFAERIEAICTTVREFKSACCDILDGVKLRTVVYGPTAIWKTKYSNLTSNDNRKTVYVEGQKVKAEKAAKAAATQTSVYQTSNDLSNV